MKRSDKPDKKTDAAETILAGRQIVPLLPLSQNVVFPGSIYPLSLLGEEASLIVEDAERNGGYVALFLQGKSGGSNSTANDLHEVGTLARLENIKRGPDGALEADAQGILPVRMVRIINDNSPVRAEVAPMQSDSENEESISPQMAEASSLYRKLLSCNPTAAEQLLPLLDETGNPNDLAYLIASTIPISVEARQELLEMTSALAKLQRIITYVRKSLEMASDGDTTHSTPDLQTLLPEQRLKLADLPPHADRVAQRELDRLAAINPASPDYNMIRSYIELLADLPWQSSPEADIDLLNARAILDRDHYGVEEVKARIIEYLAVRKLRQARKGDSADESASAEAAIAPRQPVLCLVGPPGVGKTSMGASIAEALGRPFVRISLGGVSDEAEIRGHRRTYMGAMPGRIIQALVRASSDRPVILLDELDKPGPRSKGDPAAALLDLLDPEQQHEFVDHYVDIPFDISCVLFIATANSLDTIPEALRDRLEIIELPGYTAEEKLQIAQGHIIPRQMEWHALTRDDLQWRRDGLREIIEGYTQEAGVRQLEREIATLCRKVATRIAESGEQATETAFRATRQAVRDLLGRPSLLPRGSKPPLQPGVATGLFWTPQGGEVMQIEAVMMPGNKTLTITGQLGEIMRESAQAALSYVRSRAEELGIDPDFFDCHDIHIHIPSGAVSKDGPSAGVTIACALVSLLTNKTLPSDLAMTGEVTLSGRVLPVGGIKEKILAARRAGFKRILIPTQNRLNLEEVQADLIRDLELLFADTMDDVLDACFAQPGRRSKATIRDTAAREDASTQPKQSKAAKSAR